MAGFFHLIYFQLDIVLVGYLIGSKAAGFYSTSFIILTAIYMLPLAIYQKFLLPKIHRWSKSDKQKLYFVYQQGFKLMLLLGVLSAILVIILSPQLLPWLFGDDYFPTVNLLMILALSIPFRFLISNSGSILNTRDNMQSKIKAMIAIAIINLVLNLIFIPKYGAISSAIIMVTCEILLYLIYAKLVKNFFKITLVNAKHYDY